MEDKYNYREKIRHFIEIFIILSLLGIITVNSLYLDGYDCTKLSVDDGLITNCVGYTQENHTFKYNSNENCYIQIPNNKNARQLLLDFENAANNDMDILVSNIDFDGKLTEKTDVITWKKGTFGFKINVENNEYAGYILSIPTDFTINGVYYAIPSESRIPKAVLYICVAVISVIAGLICLKSKRIEKVIGSIENKILCYFDVIAKNYKKLLIVLAAIIISILLSMLLTFIFEKNGFVKYSLKSTVLISGFILIIEVAFIFRKYFSKKIEVIGMAVILLVGTFITILEPPSPGVSWDDETHFGQSIALAHILERKQPLSACIQKERFAKAALNKRYYDEKEQNEYINYINDLYTSEYYTVFVDLSQLVTSPSVVAYIPSAVGIIISGGLNMPYHIQFIIGKWMNVLLLAILCYYAMRQLNSGKLLVLLIALIPTNIFIASNYTYDTWLTGWSLLGLCTFFGEIQRPDEKIKKKSIWLIFISMLLAVMPKMVYFPLTFIVFFMPESKFESKKDYWKYKLLILFNIAIPFVLVLVKNVISVASTSGQGDLRGGAGVDAGGQISYILNNPVQASKTLLEFLKGYLNPWIEGKEYINNMAYNGYVPCDKLVLILICFFALISRNEKEEGRYPWWFRSGVVLVYAGIGALAAISMYIVFTPVGLDTVAGCQGRYIIPALFPTLFVLTRFSGRTYVKDFIKEENVNFLAIAIMVLFSIYGLWSNCIVYY